MVGLFDIVAVCDTVDAFVVDEPERVADIMERTSESVCCHRTCTMSAKAVGGDNVAASIVVVPPRARAVMMPARRLPQTWPGTVPAPFAV